MMTERTFNILTKVIADWDEIDQIVNDILAADKKNEVDQIVIGLPDIKNGTLQDPFMLIIAGEDFASDDLVESVSFRNPISWVRNDMVQDDCITLYSKN